MKILDIKPLRRPKSRLKAVKVDAGQKLIPAGSKIKPRYWRVSVGKKYTNTKKIRKHFDTEAEALDYIAEVEGGKKTKGHSAFDIPPALAAEALKLQAELKPHGATLTDAVRFYIKNGPLIGRKTVSELIPLYLETKKEGDYRKAQKIAMGVFERTFGNWKIPTILTPDIEKWFKKRNWEPLSEGNYRRDVSMFFNWAMRKDHTTANPLKKLDPLKTPTTTPEIYTVEESRRILETALQHPELGLLPYYAVTLFSGVRVEEVERITWEMFDWEEGYIRMPGEINVEGKKKRITKTGKPRMPEIIPALSEAIKVRPTTGPIVSRVNLRKRKEKLLVLAGIKGKRNGLRHSFASYHAALYQDPGKLQMLLGQQTPGVLFKHYITATRKTDAERYFNLLPPYTETEEVAAPLPS